jgi:hypothetical protein
VQTSLIHIGNLFPELRFSVLGIVSETITLFCAILPLMNLIWEKTSIPLQWIFGAYGIVLMASTSLSVLLWPDSPCIAPPVISKQRRISAKPPLSNSNSRQSPTSYLREDTARSDESESFLESEQVTRTTM